MERVCPLMHTSRPLNTRNRALASALWCGAQVATVDACAKQCTSDARCLTWSTYRVLADDNGQPDVNYWTL